MDGTRLFTPHGRLFLLAFILFVFGQGAARADEVNIAGTTEGCFPARASAFCFPLATTPTPTATLAGLTFNGASFGGLTSGGQLLVSNFGTLTLDNTPGVYDNFNFNIVISLAQPTGLQPINPDGFFVVYVAHLSGTIGPDGQGSVSIVFETMNNPDPFVFSTPQGGSNTSGSFRFALDLAPITLRPGESATLGGRFYDASQTTTTPEPLTLVLLGTGLAGVAAAKRGKRRRARANPTRP